jgi:hypothetical protein
MTDISVQFYALAQENIHLAEEVVREFKLHVAAMRFFPFKVQKVAFDEIARFFDTEPAYSRWAFALSELDLQASEGFGFADKNKDYLRLDIGSILPKGF